MVTLIAGFFQPIPGTFADAVRVDYAGHVWVRYGDTWRNPTTGITRRNPKWTAADAYRR